MSLRSLILSFIYFNERNQINSVESSCCKLKCKFDSLSDERKLFYKIGVIDFE